MTAVKFDTRIKDPEDKLDYVINWRGGDKPGLGETESILSSVWATYDAQWVPTTELTMYPELETNDSTTAVGWVSGGINNQTYYFTNHIVTNEGRELSWSIKLQIKEQ